MPGVVGDWLPRLFVVGVLLHKVIMGEDEDAVGGLRVSMVEVFFEVVGCGAGKAESRLPVYAEAGHFEAGELFHCSSGYADAVGEAAY